MALGWITPPQPDDERLQGHETTYQSSRGGYFPEPDRPVPGAPQDQQDD